VNITWSEDDNSNKKKSDVNKKEKKVDINLLSLEDESLEDADVKDKDKKDKDKEDKTIVKINFNNENKDNSNDGVKVNKLNKKSELKIPKNNKKNKGNFPKFDEHKSNKNNSKDDKQNGDELKYEHQIRLNLNMLVFHVTQNEEVDVFDINTETKILGGIGFEYLVTNRWGLLTAFGLGSQQKKESETKTIRRLLLDVHLFACYHIIPDYFIDVYMQAGFGIIFSNIYTKTISSTNTNISISDRDLKVLQYSAIGLGCNYFITNYLFAGVESQFILHKYKVARNAEQEFVQLEVNRFFWRIKCGFAF